MAGQNLKKKSSFTISENQLSKIEKSAKVFFDLSSMKNGDLKIKSLKQILLGQGKKGPPTRGRLSFQPNIVDLIYFKL